MPGEAIGAASRPWSFLAGSSSSAAVGTQELLCEAVFKATVLPSSQPLRFWDPNLHVRNGIRTHSIRKEDKVLPN